MYTDINLQEDNNVLNDLEITRSANTQVTSYDSSTISVRSHPKRISFLFFPLRRRIAVDEFSPVSFLIARYRFFVRARKRHGWRKEGKEGMKVGKGGREEGAAKGRKAGGRVITAGLCRRAGRGYACQLEGIQLSIA